MLFLKHTYLATLAKLMVASYFQENVLYSTVSKEIIVSIISGNIFRQNGIENFLVEDFFSWIISEQTREYG
jgi:hypothetical protein